jgi:chromosome segregation ATPase
MLESFVRQLGHDLETVQPAHSSIYTDEDQLISLLTDGLPLLRSQAVYITALESEVKTLSHRLKDLQDIDQRFKNDLEEINSMCEQIAQSQPFQSSDTDNPMSLSGQLLSVHQLRTKMEVEREENDRLIQIYRMQNESVETKNAILLNQIQRLEDELTSASEYIQVLRKDNADLLGVTAQQALEREELD